MSVLYEKEEDFKYEKAWIEDNYLKCYEVYTLGRYTGEFKAIPMDWFDNNKEKATCTFDDEEVQDYVLKNFPREVDEINILPADPFPNDQFYFGIITEDGKWYEVPFKNCIDGSVYNDAGVIYCYYNSKEEIDDLLNGIR